MEKEREGKDKSRKISPSVDLVTRLDFDVLWSKWYLDPSGVGETHKTQIPEGLYMLSFRWNAQAPSLG